MPYDDKIEILSIESLPEQYSDSSVVKLSLTRQREIGARLSSRLQQLKTDRTSSGWKEDKERDFNAYHLVPPNRPVPYVGYPNLACPLPRIGIDTFHANVLYTFGGQNARFTVLPDFLSRSHMDSAERAAKYLSYVLNYESDFYMALDKADQDAEKYGNGFLEPRYCKEYVWETRLTEVTEIVPEINELTGEVTRKEVKRKKKSRVKRCVFDGVKIERVPFDCVLFSPFIEELEDAVKQDVVFKIKSYTYRNIEEMGKSVDEDTDPYLNPSKVKEVRKMAATSVISEFERNKQAYDQFQVDQKLELFPIELAEAHFWEDINDDGFAEKITVVFESSSGTILRVTYGDCRIVMLKPRPVDGRAQGESILKATAALVLEWEAIHNARVAKGQWANLPFGFYKAGGRFNPQNITLMPGKMYPIDDTSSVSFPQAGQVDVSYFNEEKIILDYFERVLALGESMQGIVPKGDTTATETINAQQRAGIRLSTPINRIAMSLNRLVGHIWELNKQCAPEVKEFRVAGIGNGQPVFDKISSKDYEVMVSFKLNMATMFDTQMVRDTALLNYRTFLGNPLVMNNPATFYELTKSTMKAVGCEINIPKPEQALAQSPFVKMDLIRAGKDVEPILGEDNEECLAAYHAMIRSEEFQEWTPEAQTKLLELRDKTLMQQTMLAMANLNKSGIFEGMPGGAQGGAPGMTASRNPSETMNRLRVGESGASQKQNVKNGSINA